VDTLGKILVVLAVVFAVVGGVLLLASRLGVDRPPGDVVYRGRNVTVYAPLGLMLLLSLVMTIALNVFLRR
jgi:hypothetical protein